MFEPFRFAFVQRGLWEVLLLAGAAGLLGTWIVLRGLAFYAHAIGTAAFPGLVLADGLGFAPLLGALGAAGVFALAVAALGRRHRDEYPSFTALVLVGALALGVILASDVFHSGSSVETLLFGSLLLIGDSDLVVAAAATATAVVATLALGRRWLATGFDPVTSRALGARSALPELALLVLVSFTVVASLAALVGRARGRGGSRGTVARRRGERATGCGNRRGCRWSVRSCRRPACAAGRRDRRPRARRLRLHGRTRGRRLHDDVDPRLVSHCCL